MKASYLHLIIIVSLTFTTIILRYILYGSDLDVHTFRDIDIDKMMYTQTHEPQDESTSGTPFSLTVENGELFARNVTLPATLSTYRNPCWFEDLPDNFTYNHTYYHRDCHIRIRRELFYQMETRHREMKKRLRCYPYFYLIGFMKCGTTDLSTALQAYHPHLAYGFIKESQFWTRRIHGVCFRPPRPNEIQMTSKNVAKFADFLNLFDNFGLQNHTTELEYDPSIVGEYTPATGHLLYKWRDIPGNEGLQEPAVTLANILYSLTPDTRIISILRNPIHRILSNYKHEVWKNGSNATSTGFHEYVTVQLSDLMSCMTNATLRGCMYDLQSPLVKGIYHVWIKDWMDVFPRKQILVLSFEDYRANHIRILNQVIDFLELDPILADTKKLSKKRVRNKSILSVDILPDTRTMLETFYRSHNKALTKLVDKSLNWTN